MREALYRHWPEYLMEAAELAAFMISACLATMLLYHHGSPVVTAIPEEFPRRILMGLAMGMTLVMIVYSPWGKRSGAHMNPAVTLAFYRLGRVAPWDAVFYMLAHFLGAAAGVGIVTLAAHPWLADPSVRFAATVPGDHGIVPALLAETFISFLLLTVVLTVSNSKRLTRATGLFAAACVATFIIVESPLSGMSMNPARTFGSAVLPQLWSGWWIYFVAPPLGMWLAAEIHRRRHLPLACAKLHHDNPHRCIFCGRPAVPSPGTARAPVPAAPVSTRAWH